MVPRLLRHFLAVVDHGSLSSAAKALAVSQPALTKTIRRLETELGVALFERRARGMVLSPFGEILSRRARLMDLELRYALSEIRAVQGGEAGTLRIGAGPVWSLCYLPQVVSRVHAIYPRAHVRVQVGVTSEVLPALRRGDVDVCAGQLEVDEAADDDIVKEALGTFEMALFVRSGHPLNRGRRPALAELLGFPWILFQGDLDLQRRLAAYFRAAQLPPPRFAVETRSFLVGLAIASQGDYVTCLARELSAEARAHDLVELPRTGLLWRFRSGVWYRRSAAEWPLVQTLLSALREEVGKVDPKRVRRSA